MNKADSVYLNHILKSILKIEKYSKGKKYRNFIRDEMLQDSIIRQIEIIGEASSKIKSETKRKYKEVPWVDIKSMRNKLIHEYFGVDVDQVWKVVQKDLPFLKKQIKKILDDVEPQISMEYK